MSNPTNTAAGSALGRKRRDARVGDYTVVDLREAVFGDQTDAEEQYAHAFASELIMPEREVRRLHRAGAGWLEMMLHFRVPADVMHRRRKELGL